jgi:secondary thiamine-phosphate synthase enzyme
MVNAAQQGLERPAGKNFPHSLHAIRGGVAYNDAMTSVRVKSHRREEIIDITPQVQRFVAASGHRSGLVAIYCPHTTAGISVNENADPDVKSDMVKFLGKLIPVSKEFRHAEGNEDAHIKAVLAGFSQVLIVEDGALVLGQWQQVWLMEFDGPRDRDVWLKIIPG